MNLTIRPVATLQGEMRPPSDKSLTHRAYMLAAAARGSSVIKNPLRSGDCDATLRCLTQLGLNHRPDGMGLRLTPSEEWIAPADLLDCGNSGTTIRLLSGLIASRPIAATLTGDASLQKRPMARIAEPLRLMGAVIDGEFPPLKIQGTGRPGPIRYESTVASAQVKSCILLAGLRANGETVITEPSLSRDHTERMLRSLGVSIISTGGQGPGSPRAVGQIPKHEVRLTPPGSLEGFSFSVPGDISSSAFFMVAAAILPEGRILFQDLSINPTRTGILDVFEQAGIHVRLGEIKEEMGEPVSDLEVKSARSDLRPFQIDGPLVPRLIDEIPILAILATQCRGVSSIKGAGELRIKESDRIELIASGLRSMGAEVEIFPDGLSVSGPVSLRAARIDSQGDHRIAMAFAIAGLLAEGETVIEGAECIATSFPRFESEIERLSIV